MSESKTNELGNIQKVHIPELEFIYIEISNDIESQNTHGLDSNKHFHR